MEKSDYCLRGRLITRLLDTFTRVRRMQLECESEMQKSSCSVADAVFSISELVMSDINPRHRH